MDEQNNEKHENRCFSIGGLVQSPKGLGVVAGIRRRCIRVCYPDSSAALWASSGLTTASHLFGEEHDALIGLSRSVIVERARDRLLQKRSKPGRMIRFKDDLGRPRIGVSLRIQPDGIRLEALADGKQYFVPYHRVLLKPRKEV